MSMPAGWAARAASCTACSRAGFICDRIGLAASKGDSMVPSGSQPPVVSTAADPIDSGSTGGGGAAGSGGGGSTMLVWTSITSAGCGAWPQAATVSAHPIAATKRATRSVTSELLQQLLFQHLAHAVAG